MSGPTKLLCATALTCLAIAVSGPTAMAQSVIKIGVSGAATGPASPNYAPNIEAFRMYVRTINDRGGTGIQCARSLFFWRRSRGTRRPPTKLLS